jgi:stearoyl-CoA desaturase (delta-9 desaturase)
LTSFLAFARRLNWIHVVFITMFHFLAAVAIFATHPRPVDIVLLVVLYFCTGFGITVGFHRLICHRGFHTPRWVRNVFAFFGTAGLQGGPVMWSMVHRRHHQVSDKPSDPHTPLFGFLYSHVGWIFLRKHARRYENMVKDVLAEPFFRWLDRPLASIVPALSLALVCYLIGGWQGMLWGTCLRTVLMWNATWCVNSFCHIMGSREFSTPDTSRNLWWVGLIALGEGWHNNHHARPRCAFHGIRWYQIDFSAMLIRLLEKVGLARNIIRPRLKEDSEPMEAAS